MKKVVVVYDNLLHKPKLHTLTSFETTTSYEYEDIFITKLESLYNIFIEYKPDIYIIDVSFYGVEAIDLLQSISEENKKGCKFIVISSNANFRELLFKSKLPDRIFSENVATDVLEATVQELANYSFLSNKFLYFEIVYEFGLKPYSSTTNYFIHSLHIANANPYLLSGHVNNIYYSISKQFNISIEAARKSIYKVIESARSSSNDDYICSIFGKNTLNNISPSSFLEIITWKFRAEQYKR